MVQKPQNDAERKERRIDLSVPQVAGSALAAVAAAVMASQLGVYGTIAGAGVMSVVATSGGPVFQHFFRRTGEQIREVTVHVKHPGGRQVTVRTRDTVPAARRPAGDATAEEPATRPDPGHPQPVNDDPERTRLLGVPDPERTRLLGTVDAERTQMLGAVDPEETRKLGAVDPERTQMFGAVGREGTRPVMNDPERTQLFGQAGTSDDAYSEARTHGTTARGWKRSALAAVAVFTVAMGGITAFEVASGNDLSGGGGTTVGSVVRGGHGPATTDPAPTTSTDPQRSGGTEDGEPGDGSASAPATDPGQDRSSEPGTGGDPSSPARPEPTPSATDGSTAPAPTGSTAPENTTPAAPEPTATGDADAPVGENGATGGPDTGR
ncbi:hypothetical protein GA0115239_102541 [Streptomyces sp. BpilaLS-43]|uniref:hypothetical protein n=1 Tax=Streptomyces sp. BpilaLS-43 TaxID=1839778 RepID=UPI00081B54F0|nr:hypothetical protein [Streptomyces sp. BpilaLS-43]SCD49517.1 hypothetical protein GA0115239_102541 [Streptomyces sp. BpilaLS-43]